jgi:CheY-like chemotaxis protein
MTFATCDRMLAETSCRYPNLQGRRVLVAEDDYLIAWDLTESLQEQGAQVIGPTTSVEATLQALAGEAAPDIALLDVSLENRESVFAVADALRTRGIPFVFYTGYRCADVDTRFGDVIHCEKPMEGAAVTAVLDAELASHSHRWETGAGVDKIHSA